MVLEVRPGHGVGPFLLGQTQKQIARTAGSGKELVRVPGHPAVLVYEDLGVLLHFSSGTLSMIEVGGQAQAAYEGIPLLHRPLRDVMRDLTLLGIDVDRDAQGAEAKGIGLGLYAPGETVDGVAVSPAPPIERVTPLR